MLIALTALLTAVACAVPPGLQSFPASPQEAKTYQPLRQLSGDLHKALLRAKANQEEEAQLHNDEAILEAALKAADQGSPIDRQQVVFAVQDIHAFTENGVLSASDKQSLQTEIDKLRKQCKAN